MGKNLHFDPDSGDVVLTEDSGGKGLLDPDQAEGLREMFPAWKSDHATLTDGDIRRLIAHDMATLREMLNPERAADAKYLRDVRSWMTSLDEHIDRLEFAEAAKEAEEK